MRAALALSLLWCSAAARAGNAPTYPWLDAKSLAGSQRLEDRFPPPTGFTRVAAEPGSFAAWLRDLPLEPGRGEVHLYDGSLKANQRAQLAVVRMDVGNRDLQQCADAVMRLRAEYLWSSGHAAEVCFALTNGEQAPWARYAKGERPSVPGKHVVWKGGAAPDGSHGAFRKYLDFVFIYAGSSSLQRYHLSPRAEAQVQAGDVFVQGGFPGHAVIVVDAVEDAQGHRRVALAQSYMPAQQAHVLDNPATPGSPWYEVPTEAPLLTPEWKFPPHSLRRFATTGCPSR